MAPVVLTHRRMRTVTNYFLLNLAIADSSISIFNVCFSFIYNLYYQWIFGYHYCIFNNFMGVAPTCASVFTLMCMSLDRYMAIVHPLRTRLSRRKTIGAIVFIWFFAALCASPNIYSSYTETYFFYWNQNAMKATVCHSNGFKYPIHFTIYNYFLLVASYCLPLVVLSVTYSRVALSLWGSQSIGEHRQEDSIRTKKRVIKMMIVIVTIFLVCWLPYHVYFSFLQQELSSTVAPIVVLHIYLNMYWLAMSSTIMNPIIYCWMNKRFRTGFKYVFRWVPGISITREQYISSDLMRNDRRQSMMAAQQRVSCTKRPSELPSELQVTDRFDRNRNKSTGSRGTRNENGVAETETMVNQGEISPSKTTF